MTRDYEVVRDPLWDNIALDAVALAALDTPAVQRLRYVRQLGHAFLVYPGATHTRFEHALGAYHLTQRALAALQCARRAGPGRSRGPARGRSRRAAPRHRALPLLARARGSGLPVARGDGRRPARQGSAGRRPALARRAGAGGRGRPADPGPEQEPAAGPHLRNARPRQDRLPEPRRPDVRRAVRHPRRGPAARLAHAGARPEARRRGRHSREGRERARIAALRQVPDVPERVLAPRGPERHLHVQARRARARCGAASSPRRGSRP